jgi:adenosylhomocysteine nucleosidase
LKQRIIGIMGAMPEEINGIIDLIEDKEKFHFGHRLYYKGTLQGNQVVAVISGWGKVAAATTVTNLITRFQISELIFTGVAGAMNHNVAIGDIVLAKRLIQHDMDARPLIPQFEIPQLGKAYFETRLNDIQKAASAIQNVLDYDEVFQTQLQAKFNIDKPTFHLGDIASGDQFFSNGQQKSNLLKMLPSILCVEMEGAAVAQVCEENKIPFTIVRTISDGADDDSVVDFQTFITEIASHYSIRIVQELLRQSTDSNLSMETEKYK